MVDYCSAYQEGCLHGHATNMGCRTNPLGDNPGAYRPVPYCLREDCVFDEVKQVVTHTPVARAAKAGGGK